MERFNPLFCYQNNSYLRIGGQNYCSIVDYDCEYQDKVLIALAREHMPDGNVRAHGVCACTIVDVIEGAIDSFVTEEPVLRPLRRMPHISREIGGPET